MPGPVRRLVHVLWSVALLSLALVFVEATAASAQGTWSAPKSIDVNSTPLDSVSCPSATFCTVVDFEGDALTYNGSSWSSPKSIDDGVLNSVSCASASFCAAVDAGGYALTYKGSSWSSPSDIDPSNSLLSVSCPSASFCVAIDGAANAFTYNGSSWSSPKSIDYPYALESVSCASASFCATVNDSGTALTYNGSSWSSPSDFDGFNYLPSVSCPSATFCTAVDDSGSAFTYNGSSWSSAKSIDAINLDNSVSCSSASFCAAVNDSGNAFTYNGSSWSSPSDVDASNDLSSVSCPSANFCAAVDGSGNVLTYTSSATTPTTSVIIPSNGATVSGTTTLDASASNATSVEFRLFGGSYGYNAPVLCTATLTYYGWVCSWNTTTVPNGSYSILSEASGAGGSTFSSGVSITVHNAPAPTTSVLVPSNGATLSGSSSLDASASNASSVEFRLFGGSYGYNAPVLCTATLTYYGWVCSWNTTTVPNGSYTLVSEAIGAGGTTFSSGISITVHN